MGTKKAARYICWNLILALFISMGIQHLYVQSEFARLHADTVSGTYFRSQPLNQELLDYIKTTDDPGEILGLYWLETNFQEEIPRKTVKKSDLDDLRKKWGAKKEWEAYVNQCRGIWNELKYFPVPEPTKQTKAGISFVDSWMYDRNYGGKRGHEGTDIMADRNERGFYPIVSMTDGTIRHKGWLEQGGWRIGIVSPRGTYFYYAHLDSYADFEEGDTVNAGDVIGYMGDSGYGKKEGTVGNFPTHLHLGIYLFHKGEEISINPYWPLKYTESRKIKCVYPR